MRLHAAFTFRPSKTLGELREDVLCKTAFNHYHLLWSFSGLNIFKYPSNSSLVEMFRFYDSNLWLHVGASLRNTDDRDAFIEGYRWVVERPAFGPTTVHLKTEDLIEALRFKLQCEEIGVVFASYDEPSSWGNDFEDEQGPSLIERLLQRLRCPSRAEAADEDEDLQEAS